MKHLLSAILIVFSVVIAKADGNNDTKSENNSNPVTLTVTGSVSDANTGEMLVGVEIKLEATDLKTYSDFDGNFSFDNVKQGEYKVVANYISYQKKTETLKVPSDKNELKIKLHSSN